MPIILQFSASSMRVIPTLIFQGHRKESILSPRRSAVRGGAALPAASYKQRRNATPPFHCVVKPNPFAFFRRSYYVPSVKLFRLRVGDMR